MTLLTTNIHMFYKKLVLAITFIGIIFIGASVAQAAYIAPPSTVGEAVVYGRLKFESGGHRVQRVPATESQGRIHTSACTVADSAAGYCRRRGRRWNGC